VRISVPLQVSCHHGAYRKLHRSETRRDTAARHERGTRVQCQWTQQELADKVGIRYETICRLENQRNAEPRLSVARKLARALGVTLETKGQHGL
jgi:DNA-binding XRE family transcriptional regulator